MNKSPRTDDPGIAGHELRGAAERARRPPRSARRRRCETALFPRQKREPAVGFKRLAPNYRH
jgi:hypothetical protein